MHVSFKAIGRNIRAARTALDITQEEAADRLKISQLHFGRLERGERPISLEMLAQIASVLDVSLSALLNGCMIGEDFSQRPSRGSESLGQSVDETANVGTAAPERLMHELGRGVAQSKKQSDDNPEGEGPFFFIPVPEGRALRARPTSRALLRPSMRSPRRQNPFRHTGSEGVSLIPAILQSPIETEPG